jgi:hypothetical protein
MLASRAAARSRCCRWRSSASLSRRAHGRHQPRVEAARPLEELHPRLRAADVALAQKDLRDGRSPLLVEPDDPVRHRRTGRPQVAAGLDELPLRLRQARPRGVQAVERPVVRDGGGSGLGVEARQLGLEAPHLGPLLGQGRRAEGGRAGDAGRQQARDGDSGEAAHGRPG